MFPFIRGALLCISIYILGADSNSDGETVQSTAQRKTTDSKNNPKFGAEESSLVSAIEEKESEKIEVEDKAQDVVKSEVENRQAKVGSS